MSLGLGFWDKNAPIMNDPVSGRMVRGGSPFLPFAQVANPPTNITWIHNMDQTAAIVGRDHTGLQNNVSYFTSSTIPTGAGEDVADFRNSNGNHYLNINDSANFVSFEDDISVMLECWAFIPSSAPSTGNGCLICQHQPSFNRRSWRLNYNYQFNFFQFAYHPNPSTSGGSTFYSSGTNAGGARDEWHHVAFQRARVAANSYRCTMFVNGVAGPTAVRTDRAFDNNIDWIKLGANENSADVFNGFLGPIRCIENEVLYPEDGFPRPTARWTL